MGVEPSRCLEVVSADGGAPGETGLRSFTALWCISGQWQPSTPGCLCTVAYALWHYVTGSRCLALVYSPS